MNDSTPEISKLIAEAAKKARSDVSMLPEPNMTTPVEWPVDCTVGPGLEGAIACETKVGYVNGSKGWLVYRGYDIFDLCANSSFEEVSYLLLHGQMPTLTQLRDYNDKLIEDRFLSHTLRHVMSFPLEEMNPMSALRLGINLMRQRQTDRDMRDHVRISKHKTIGTDEDSIPMEEEPRGTRKAIYEFSDHSVEKAAANRKKAEKHERRVHNLDACYHLISGTATIAAAISRLREHKLPIEPRADMSHAANLLYMMTGEVPTPEQERLMDVVLILHADHGMNASTFATMVVASTLSDIYFSVGAGIAALNGPLHGGANEQVLKTLREIGDPEKVDRWYKKARREKRKIMGFGHRVYKAYDPRARVLGPLAKQVVGASDDEEAKRLLQIAQRLEELVVKDLGGKKGIFPNVDFYSGLVYAAMGIDSAMFTPLFAVSRVAGWTARTIEYLKNNRIFRPRGVYVGGFDKAYVPISERHSDG